MKNIIVIGANSAVGQALVKMLDKSEAFNIIACSRSPRKTNHTFSDNVLLLGGIDLLVPSDLEKLKQAVDARFHSEFHVVNAVGKYFDDGHRAFHEVSVSDSDSIMKSNYQTVYNAANTLIPLQKTKGGGHFIAFSCNSVKYSYPMMGAFTASKAAIENLISTLANEYFKYGIIANAFQLSTIDTEAERSLKPNSTFENWLQPEEIADFVVEFINLKTRLISGNAIHIYKHSEDFFGKSYYQRVTTV